MRLLLIFIFSVALVGCEVGPNYRSPDIPMPSEYSEDLPDKTFAVEDENLVNWWIIFKDPFLELLLQEALFGSFDYRIALEQVYQARAQYWVQFTQILPEIDGDFQATRFKTSQSFASSPAATAASAASTTAAASSTADLNISPYQNFFQAGFDAVWEIDLFGRLRRTAQSAFDTWEAAAEESRAVKIVVLSEVVNIYTAICALQKKTNIAAQVVDLDENLLQFSKDRFESGLADEQEVEAAIGTLEQDKANLLVLQTSLKFNIYSLGILLGMQPETLLEDFNIERPIPYAGGKIPAGLPSDLLRRRPDIRSAERTLAANTELIGAAIADLFPKVSLVGSSSSFAANPLQGANIGYSSDSINKLFSPRSLIWGYGTLITFPVFDFGKRFASVDVQRSIQHQAYLTYQKTVIEALQEVEQALISYFNEEERESDLNKAAQANKRALDLATDLFESGIANFTQVLVAKNAWLNSVNTLADSQQALTTDLIAVYKALGGDW